MTRPEKIFSVTLALPNFNQVTGEERRSWYCAFLGLWSWDTCGIHSSAAAAADTRQEHGVFSLTSEVAINSLKCGLAPSLPEKHAAGLGGQWAPEFLRTFPSGLFFLTDLISQLHLRLRRHFHLIRVSKGQDEVRASSEVLLGCYFWKKTMRTDASPLVAMESCAQGHFSHPLSGRGLWSQGDLGSVRDLRVHSCAVLGSLLILSQGVVMTVYTQQPAWRCSSDYYYLCTDARASCLI